MSKLILFLFLGLLAFLLFKTLKRPRPPDSDAKPKHRPTERMVVCATCGVHLPESEAIADSSQHYCCEEHRRIHP